MEKEEPSHPLNRIFWKALATPDVWEQKFCSEKEDFYVEVRNGRFVILPLPDGTSICSLLPNSLELAGLTVQGSIQYPALVLFSVHLPEHLQRRGNGTRIIQILKERAQSEGKVFGVFGLTTEPICNLCDKLGLRSCMPFSCYEPSQKT